MSFPSIETFMGLIGVCVTAFILLSGLCLVLMTNDLIKTERKRRVRGNKTTYTTRIKILGFEVELVTIEEENPSSKKVQSRTKVVLEKHSKENDKNEKVS